MLFFKLLLISVLSFLVLACTEDLNQTDTPEQFQITGQFSYRERVMLPPDSTAKIKLEDVTTTDKAAELIHIKSMPLKQQVPIPFSLTVAKQNLQARHRYTLHVSVYAPDGHLMWTTDRAYQVDISNNKQDVGDILLVRTTPTSAAFNKKKSRYQCGDKTVAVSYQDDIAILEFDQESTSLIRVKAASGAKYASADGQLTFWTKADKATLSLADTSLPECQQLKANALLTGAEWIVEDIDQRGIIDYSRVTLNFNQGGRLSGLASCNQYTAAYQLGETIQISQAIATKKACPTALMNQESRFLKLLTQVNQLEFDPMGALLLSTADGRTITARR